MSGSQSGEQPRLLDAAMGKEVSLKEDLKAAAWAGAFLLALTLGPPLVWELSHRAPQPPPATVVDMDIFSGWPNLLDPPSGYPPHAANPAIERGD